MPNTSQRDFLKDCQKKGWTITRTGGGHLRLTHPKASTPVFMGSTSSDWRAFLNAQTNMRRALSASDDGKQVKLDTPRRHDKKKSRVPPVVEMTSLPSKPLAGPPSGRIRAEWWPQGFSPKAASEVKALVEPTLLYETARVPEPSAPPSPAPTVHVMPTWKPSGQTAESAEVAAPPKKRGRPRKIVDVLPAPAEPKKRGRPRKIVDPMPVAVAPKKRGRPSKVQVPTKQCADPFNSADDGANCFRCGYLIEKSREERGLYTCKACGKSDERS